MINNQGLKVFIHCNSGATRAPSLVITYLCLLMKVKEYYNTSEAEKLVR
jgi:protein-tyrosine phosphatase